MVGPSAAGKTITARLVSVRLGLTYVSLDELREVVIGQIDYAPEDAGREGLPGAG